MFCPFCGDTLVLRKGEMYCPTGDMELAHVLSQSLTACYADITSPKRINFTPNYRGGADQFCPGCGIKVDKEFNCPHCGKSVKELIYQLVEFHPHRHTT